MTIFRAFGASAVAQLAVPSDQTRANLVTAWGQLVATKAQVLSAQAPVRASEIALNGVREEAKAGHRTTLDVLNAQQAPASPWSMRSMTGWSHLIPCLAQLDGSRRRSSILRPRPMIQARALSSGSRQLVWLAHARWSLIAQAEPPLRRTSTAPMIDLPSQA